MKKILLVTKPQGLTPLQTIHKLQERHNSLASERIGYAGRLDPMAEGLLLLLVGEENTKRKQYERLDKEYEVEIVFGISTDSFDALGIASSINSKPVSHQEVEVGLKSFIGTFLQEYPAYSAARVNGRPLYYWARAGKLTGITLPSKQVTIDSAQLLHLSTLNNKDLFATIESRIKKVTGAFRQDEILARWKDVLGERQTFSVARIRITCSSGTYMRSIAHELGEIVGSGAFALSIRRTRIGAYTLKDAEEIR